MLHRLRATESSYTTSAQADADHPRTTGSSSGIVILQRNHILGLNIPTHPTLPTVLPRSNPIHHIYKNLDVLILKNYPNSHEYFALFQVRYSLKFLPFHHLKECLYLKGSPGKEREILYLQNMQPSTPNICCYYEVETSHRLTGKIQRGNSGELGWLIFNKAQVGYVGVCLTPDSL